MPLDYDVKNKYETLLPVLDEHTEWFHCVVESCFYPKEHNSDELCQKPVSFAQWTVTSQEDKSIQPELLEKLTTLHHDLVQAADDFLVNGNETDGRPDHKVFLSFLTLYEEFQNNVRRLEKDFMREDSGYDAFTGLRSKKLMVDDIEREMHRLSRQGKKFTLAMARIDKFDQIKEYYSQSEHDACIKLVADLIKASIRSFDDAYHLNENEFVLCLKQTDISGGIAAMERLRKELERQKIMLQFPDKETPFSLSCCIAEPVEGDRVHELITNLQADLKDTDDREDTVLEFYEMSPLQRYVHDTTRH